MKLNSLGKQIVNKFFRNKPYFSTKDVKLGKNVSFGKNVIFNCQSVRIGDGVVFQDNITINVDFFEIGDFGTIYSGCFFPGPGKIKIGHNFWLGAMSIIDSQGGTMIGNNVGIGAHSQLWTHMKYGDVMAGCRFNSVKPLIIEDDAWLVGHVLVSPVHIGQRSLIMLGSVVVNDVSRDRTFAGVPARDMTDKFGTQFQSNTIEQRIAYISKKIEDFADKYKVEDIWSKVLILEKEERQNNLTEQVILNVSCRTYRKNGTKFERQLIRYLLPDCKFIPKQDYSKK